MIAKTIIYKRKYFGTSTSFAMPDRSIYKDRKYSPLALIETGRGCNFSCEFCAIHSYYEKNTIVDLLKKWYRILKIQVKSMYFSQMITLLLTIIMPQKSCKAIAPLKIKWVTQGAITMAKMMSYFIG